MDATQIEKIYVAIGDDVQDGFKTLDWALKKWNSHPISIVILRVSYSKDYVYTPSGKLPARFVNYEKLEVLRKHEQEKINKLLSKYRAFCGKVPAKILEVGKFDELIQKRVIDLITGLGITKLVMGFSFMKPFLKSKGAISGFFYVHQHKPSFCELFIICAGKQVFLRGKNDEKIIKDDNGVMVASLRGKVGFKDWLDRVFRDKNIETQDKSSSTPSTNLDSPVTQSQWEFYLQEIENYYQELLSSNLEEASSSGQGSDDSLSQISPIEPDVIIEQNDSNMSTEEKIEILQNKLNKAHKIIQLKRKEAKDNLERHAKAEWAICLCNSLVEEIESRIKEEDHAREELKKELGVEKEQINELRIDVAESRRKLKSLAELQSENSNRLHISTLAKSRAETQLDKAMATRTEMLREIEEVRRQRDVLNRRIEFCKQKDAIGISARLNETTCCGFREYTEEELRLATDNFSEQLRLKSGGDWTNVYRGRINHSTVAMKMFNSFPSLSEQDFETKVRLLGGIRYPHLVAMVGFCSEPKCIVLEYMHNGSLRDMLFSKTRRRNRVSRWHDRIRIATEVCSGLGFLNATQARPITHYHLNPSNVLLDRNLVAKITGFGLHECQERCKNDSAIRAFGLLLLHLLTGRNWAGLVEEAMTVEMDSQALAKVLDEMAGQWPLDLAKELAGLAMRCLKSQQNQELSIARVMEELNEMRRKGDDIVVRERQQAINGGIVDRDSSSDVPNAFLCPILQEVMKNPSVAADGFSYELEAIKQWLQLRHDTSPMTNLKLKHTMLIPNHSLRSQIQDWLSNR